MNTNFFRFDTPSGSVISPDSLANVAAKAPVARLSESRRLIESLRVMLAIIAGLLMLDAPASAQGQLSIAVISFSIYAVALFWMAANGSDSIRQPIVYWLDAAWFLLLLSLASGSRTQYFLFLFFPVFFAAWRAGYRESIAIAAFSGLASVVIFALHDPGLTWTRILALPLSLFIVGPLFVTLARVEAATQKSQAFAARIVEGFDPRRGFDFVIPELIGQIALQMGASDAILAVRGSEGKHRVFCWEAENGSSELSESAALSLVERALSLTTDIAFGWSGARHWWEREHRIAVGPSGVVSTPSPVDCETLSVLAHLVGKSRLVSVKLTSIGIGDVRLMLAGESIEVRAQSVETLLHIVEQISPSVENTCLRERLATEAAETERARIGRDLHDSAIQPYIGLKFALEAVQRRAGSDNPITEDLARLVDMVTDELATMREVISGLRGAPGKGGALLSSAVRRQASRFEQLFGIQVDVEVDGEMPVSRRIAGEMFHIVAEGLSNIRRHTQARQASISLSSADGSLVLSISNPNDSQTSVVPDFTPVSLTERAAALGGSAELDYSQSRTTVTVRVPMPSNTEGEQCQRTLR